MGIDGEKGRMLLQVVSTLNRLETVTSFSEFVKSFGLYGSQMVELAHLTGDRQNVNDRFIKNLSNIIFRSRISKMNDVDLNYLLLELF